jgi:hypothetical protein
MGYIGKVKVGNNTHLVASTLYGTCTTEAATAAKVVSCSNFSQLETGVTIHVRFKYSNTATNPTLNVNSTGAINIKRYGDTSPGTSSTTSWYANSVVSFTYDGTSWMMNDFKYNTNTDEKVKIDSITTTSSTKYYYPTFSNSTDTTGYVYASAYFKVGHSDGETILHLGGSSHPGKIRLYDDSFTGSYGTII